MKIRIFVFVFIFLGSKVFSSGLSSVDGLGEASQFVELHLYSGENIQGELISQSKKEIVIKTDFGQLDIATKEIKNMDFLSPDVLVDLNKRRNWYFSDKQLVDVWFDPTGFTLDKGDFYISFLSWGFGVTDNLQVTTAWYRYFLGDLNLRAKYKIFDKGISSRQAFSVGAHLHTASHPDKYEYKTFERKSYGYYDDKQQKFVDDEKKELVSEWVQVGSQYRDGYYDSSDGAGLWGEVFMAYTLSNLRESGAGRVNYTVGASAILFPDTPVMPRVYFAVDVDVHENFKVLGEMFYDPYYRPMNNNSEEDIDIPLFFDFGFMTNKVFGVERLWLGIHFQKPIISGFYRF